LSWKRWFRQFLLVTLAAYFLLGLAVNFIIDPYGEWNLVSTRFNAKKFWQIHQTAPYKFSESLERDRYTLVFGTSHSATISEALVGNKVLNLSVSLYGNPFDVEAFLKGLSPAALRNIEKVYYDVDYAMLFDKKSEFEKRSFSRWNFFLATLATLDPAKLQRAFRTVYANLFHRYTSFIEPNGVFVFDTEVNFDFHSAEAQTLLQKTTYYSFDPKAAEALKRVEAFLEQQKIPRVYFNTAFSSLFLKQIDPTSFKQHLQAIAGAVPEFCALNYLEGVSEDLALFRDPTHHKFSVTGREMGLLREQKCPTPLTSANVAEYVDWFLVSTGR
jgi:hypothetical protein